MVAGFCDLRSQKSRSRHSQPIVILNQGEDTTCWPVSAETIEISDNHGGSVAQYDSRRAGLAARGVDVKIVGPCQSACTVLLGHIPRSKIWC
jgi:hypothetical protein